MAQPESKLSRAIMAELRARGVWCMKIHGGPTMLAGAPDIVACVPVIRPKGATTWEVIGIFVGFETKTPTGGDPSPIQARQHDKIRAACGHVFVPRTVQDAVAALESLGWIVPPGHPGSVSAAI